jgi:hypothetical protein
MTLKWSQQTPKWKKNLTLNLKKSQNPSQNPNLKKNPKLNLKNLMKNPIILVVKIKP